MTYIIILGLHEAMCLTGLVLGFLIREPERILPFAIANLFLNAMVYPRTEATAERVEKILRTNESG